MLLSCSSWYNEEEKSHPKSPCPYGPQAESLAEERTWKMNTQKAIDFIKSNARPIELAEFACHFENGSKQALIDALKPYQNPDGGFGNALEPDNWNPHSTPITTNAAIGYLFQAGALGEAKEMAAGAARYLLSGDSFDQERQLWLSSIDSNKDHPHAVWWEKGENDVPSWNPSVSLAAFLVCMGAAGPWKQLVQKAFIDLEQEEEKSGDNVKCYILAYGLLKEYGIANLVDLDQARQTIQAAIQAAICQDVEKYGVEYVVSPSWFFQGSSTFLIPDLLPLIQAEREALGKLQLEDGGFDISWVWHTPYKREFQQARKWWRPRVTMEKLLFYRQFAK